MKGKALRRALETSQAYRITGDIPLITDTTELITPEVAYAMLEKNQHNRPIGWARVEEYATIMREGKWELHAQGIILDTSGNILTGQKRLWAVIYSGISVYMRVSRGNPPTVAKLLDRGTPQSARDLAARDTGRKHSPSESSLARAILAMEGILKPSLDVLATHIEENACMAQWVLEAARGTKKSKAVLMILAAICHVAQHEQRARELVTHVETMVAELQARLNPQSAEECWRRGAGFTLAMGHARTVVRAYDISN